MFDIMVISDAISNLPNADSEICMNMEKYL